MAAETFTADDFATTTTGNSLTFTADDFSKPQFTPEDFAPKTSPVLAGDVNPYAVKSPDLQATTRGGPPLQLPEAGVALRQAREEISQQFGEVITHPSPIPTPFTIDKNENPFIAAGKEAVNLAVGIPQFFTTGLGIATIPAAAAAPTIVAGAFTLDMLKSLGEQIHSTYQNWSKMTPTEKTVAVEQMVATGALAGITGKATVKGASAFAESNVPRGQGIASPETKILAPLTTAETTTTEVTNAETIRRNQGQLPPTGEIAQGSETPRRDDLQQVAPGQPESVVTREILAPQTEKAVKEIVQPEDVSGSVLVKSAEVPSPQVQTEEAAQPPPPPPAQPVGTEAGKAVPEWISGESPPSKVQEQFKAIEQRYRNGTPSEKMALDLISDNEFATRRYDPSRMSREGVTDESLSEAHDRLMKESGLAWSPPASTPEPPASQKPSPPAPTSEGKAEGSVEFVGTQFSKFSNALVSKDPKSGKWRLTWFNEFSGTGEITPFGHKEYASRASAIKAAKRLEYVEKQPTPPPTAGAGEKPTRFGKGGPGAAAATEPGTYDPAAQLSDALKTVKETDPLKRAQDISRVTELWEVGKDATTRAWGRVVAAKESIKDTLLNQDEITPLKRLVAALDFQIQKSSAMSRDLGRTFEQTHPNRVRRNAIAIFVDAGLDAEKVKAAISELPEKTPRRVRRAFEAAAELTPKERDTAERIKTYFEQRLQDAQQAGVLKGFLEDYYTHVWKKPERMPEDLKNAMSNGRVVTYFENARQRSLQDFITGVKLGLETVLDPALVVPRYNFNLDRAIASRAFVKKLSETTEADGRTTVAPTGIGRQVSSTEYIVRNDETGRTRRVFETREEANAAAREGESVVERENTATMISPKTKSPESEGYVVVDNPALRKWKWATNDSAGNPILVEGDLVVHPDAVNRIKNIMERERLTPGKSMRFLIRAGAEVKGAKLGVLSPFHQIHVGSHALFHLVNPFSLKPEIDWTHPFTKFAVEKGGLKLAADFHDKMAFSEGIGPGLIVQKIVPFARMYSEYLFESFIPRLKLKTFEAVYQRDLKRYAGKLSEEQIAARAGDAVNNAYGELNRLWLGKDGRDPRLQRAMQVTMLAPDFLEGRVRFVAKAFTKYGKEERMALFVMGASLYVTARVLNQLFDGDPHATEPNMMFSVRVGDKNYSIRSVLGDLNHFLTDWRSFASTRINPVTTRTAVELLTKRDIRTGESVTTAQEAADMLRQVVPSQLDSMLPGDRQWWFGFMQSLGLTARRQPTPEEIAKRKAKEEKEKEHPSKVEIIYKKRGVPDVIGTPSSKKKR